MQPLRVSVYIFVALLELLFSFNPWVKSFFLSAVITPRNRYLFTKDTIIVFTKFEWELQSGLITLKGISPKQLSLFVFFII